MKHEAYVGGCAECDRKVKYEAYVTCYIDLLKFPT